MQGQSTTANEIFKSCRKCGRSLPSARFPRRRRATESAPEVLEARCKECKNEADRNRPRKPNEQRADRRHYFHERRYNLISHGLCNQCGNNPPAPDCSRCEACIERRRLARPKETRIVEAARVKDQVFTHYGGYECRCCGETLPILLTIDHVKNDGAAHRRKIMNGKVRQIGSSFYSWLRSHGFPEGFQVLCYNCNIGKYRNGGICPHQVQREGVAA